MERVNIIADHREQRSGIVRALSTDSNVDLTVVELEVGDYQIGDQWFIERKSSADFTASILDRRLFAQLDKAKEAQARVAYLIEGDIFRSYVGLSPESLAGALSYLTCFEGVPVVSGVTPDKAPLIIRTMAHHVQHGLLGSFPGLRPATPKSPGDRARWLLIGLPGLGESRVDALLEHFGSARAVMNASVEQIKQVPGIGAKTAQGIVDVLDMTF